MSTRQLISMAGSILITGASILMLLPHSTTPLPQQPSTIDGLPVTNLPGITVTARVKAPARRHRPHHLVKRPVASVHGDGPSLLSNATAQLAMPHLRMPYYSFGSVSVQINKD